MNRFHVFGFLVGTTVLFFGFSTFQAFGETIIRTLKPIYTTPLAHTYIEDPNLPVYNPLNELSASSSPLILGLRLGSIGEPVRTLQLILNSSSTSIVAYGNIPGSPGQESTYFGAKTEAALKKFQKTHMLSQTGWVDVQTFNTLNVEFNRLLKANYTDSSVQNIQTTKFSSTDIFNPFAPTSPFYDSLQTTGGVAMSESDKNKFEKVFNRARMYDSQLKPNNTVTPDIFTRTGNGPVPVITSVSPTAVRSGDYITITGKNFSKSNNTVISGFEVFKNVVSDDGTTIRIRYDSEYQRRVDAEIKSAGGDKEQKKAREAFRKSISRQNQNFPITLSVSTENGMSNQMQIGLILQ